jgi:hypothetical protein
MRNAVAIVRLAFGITTVPALWIGVLTEDWRYTAFACVGALVMPLPFWKARR